ncbi:hypothetical protein LCQ81_04385 [Bifidobacterium longum]|nr:hypothetical protein LCQ81_04385 [Bifidobacterium longum]
MQLEQIGRPAWRLGNRHTPCSTKTQQCYLP